MRLFILIKLNVISILLLLYPIIGTKSNVLANNIQDLNLTKSTSPKMILLQQDRTGTMLVYFVVNEKARKTGRVFIHILQTGEDSYSAKTAIRKKHEKSLAENESFSLSATSIKPGKCAVVYSGTVFGYRHGLMKSFDNKTDANAFINNAKINDSDDFKLSEILCCPKIESDKTTTLSDAETVEIYDFMFGKGSGNGLGEITKNDKKVANAMLKQLVSGSCKMGYVQTLTTTAMNPSATATKVILKVVKHHITNDCATNLKNGKIYQSVFNRIKSVWVRKFQTRKSLNSWK